MKMSMQDYNNTVDRIEISPKVRQEVLSMTTAVKQRTSINWMRIGAAAAVFALVAGIGGAIGYAAIRERTPQVGYSETIEDPASVTDLSVFGLDAANFFRDPQADSNVNIPAGPNKDICWPYEGESPALTAGAAYADADHNLLYLSSTGEFLGIETNLSEEQTQKLQEYPEGTIHEYLQAMLPDFDQFTENTIYSALSSIRPPFVYKRHYENGTEDMVQVEIFPNLSSGRTLNIHVMRCHAENEHFLDADRYLANVRGIKNQLREKIQQSGLNVQVLGDEGSINSIPMLMRFDDGKIYAVDSVTMVLYDEEGTPCQTVSKAILADPTQDVRYDFFGEILAECNGGEVPQFGTQPSPFAPDAAGSTVYTTMPETTDDPTPPETTINPADIAEAAMIDGNAPHAGNEYSGFPLVGDNGEDKTEPGHVAMWDFGFITVGGLYTTPPTSAYANYAYSAKPGYLFYYWAEVNQAVPALQDVLVTGSTLLYQVFDENHQFITECITEANKLDGLEECTAHKPMFCAKLPLKPDIMEKTAYITCWLYDLSMDNGASYSDRPGDTETAVPIATFHVNAGMNE